MKFELEKFNRNTTDNELIADIKLVATQIKKSPTMEEYNEKGKYRRSYDLQFVLSTDYGSLAPTAARQPLQESTTPPQAIRLSGAALSFFINPKLFQFE